MLIGFDFDDTLHLGGEGAGVQILDATEARGRTFDHLFLIGLNGGVFPRTLREDPVLGDPLRRVLARSGTSVLPDLPVKREGSDVTVIAISKMLQEALAAAETLQGEGVSVEVVDPRTLVPLDKEEIGRAHV